jgi:hypothetical protein
MVLIAHSGSCLLDYLFVPEKSAADSTMSQAAPDKIHDISLELDEVDYPGLVQTRE